FRLVTATNRNLRELVRQEMFRSDLYYRMAVIELRVPNMEERGAIDKVAIFTSVVTRLLGAAGSEAREQAAPPEIPDWLLQLIAQTRFNGNVRELRNIAERIAIIHRQFGDWDRDAIERVFSLDRDSRMEDDGSDEQGKKWGSADHSDRARIIEALNAHNWRRQDTAHYLNISRKVLWEKMRKLQIIDGDQALAGESEP
ncbi:MAG TPA: helix-turn-helix domain-containing protein, partial [Herbaspirillum sp.]|nr:helix-turn-helix domain-containing protein [Herbaspirillum sp.]